MPSPFPGMDPYLENSACWPDFYASFVLYMRNAILANLPESYEARIDERLTLVESSEEQVRHFLPDVAITQDGNSLGPNSTKGAIATIEPVTLPVRIEEEYRETRLEVFHWPERTLVTVIELLSPNNKDSRGRDVYLAKRHGIWWEPVHLVEIDLLLEGQRFAPVTGNFPARDYFAILSRHERRPNCEVYHWSVRDPLPTIPIPLAAPDPDIPLDLAAVFRQTFQDGRYERTLSYRDPLTSNVPPATREWIAAQAAAARKS